MNLNEETTVTAVYTVLYGTYPLPISRHEIGNFLWRFGIGWMISCPLITQVRAPRSVPAALSEKETSTGPVGVALGLRTAVAQRNDVFACLDVTLIKYCSVQKLVLVADGHIAILLTLSGRPTANPRVATVQWTQEAREDSGRAREYNPPHPHPD